MEDGNTSAAIAEKKQKKSIFKDTQPPFLKHRHEALAMKAEDVGTVHMNPSTAGRYAVAASVKLEPYADLIAELPDQRVQPLERLRELGLGTIHADYAISTVPAPQRGLSEVIAEGFKARDELGHWVGTLSRYGLMSSATLDNAEGGTSREKVAKDILSMSGEMLKVWDEIAPSTLMAKSAIFKARDVASELLAELTFGTPSEDGPLARLREMRRRFFALLKQDYHLVRKAAIYRLGDVLDVDELIPPLHQGRKKGSSTAAPGAPADEEATTYEAEVAEGSEAPGIETAGGETSTEVAADSMTETAGTESPCVGGDDQ